MWRWRVDPFRAQPKRRCGCRRIPGVLVLLGVMAGVAVAGAQSPGPSAGELAFEVVSIKAVAPGRIPLIVGTSCVFPNNGVRFRCVASTLQQLIGMAFRFGDVPVPQSQIVGAPDWSATSQFEITALLNTAVERGNFSPRLPALLRPVLEDRFNLKTHVERRPLQVYALVSAFDDGRLGPQLREAATNCPPVPSDAASKLPVPAVPSEKVCWGGNFQTGTIRAGALTMPALAAYFTRAGLTDRIVLDRTDLIGRFEVDLRWSPMPVSAAEPGAAHLDRLDQPSLFAALQEQLGLKLEPRTELMDVLVIDHAELPTPN